MTKRQVRSKAYRSIVKGNKKHQELFEELKVADTGLTNEELADELAKIPSPQRISALKNIRYIFVVVMAMISIIRIFTLLGLRVYLQDVNIFIILIAVVFSLIIPILGTVAVFTHRTRLYYVTGGFLAYTLFKAFTSSGLIIDSTSITSLIPVVAGVILAFYIPYQLKIKYKKVNIENEQGELETSYRFETIDKKIDPDLLDA